jgi:hypothetical protein
MPVLGEAESADPAATTLTALPDMRPVTPTMEAVVAADSTLQLYYILHTMLYAEE